MSLNQISDQNNNGPFPSSNLRVKSINGDLVHGETVKATHLRSIPLPVAIPSASDIITYDGIGSWIYTPAPSGGGIPEYSAGSFDLYFSPASGNDANDGSSAGQAVATWGRMQELGSGYNTDLCTIHLFQSESYAATILEDLDVPIVDTINATEAIYTKVLDFSKFGAREIKVTVDMTGLEANTPASATTVTYTTGSVNFKYYTHAAITTDTSYRWTYDATQDEYNTSHSGYNTATETYIINNSAPLNALEYYDDADLATFNFGGTKTVLNTLNKIITFERIAFQTNYIYATGDIYCRGCLFNGIISTPSSQISTYGCNLGSFTLIAGNSNCQFSFTDSGYEVGANTTNIMSLSVIDANTNVNDGASLRVYASDLGPLVMNYNASATLEACGSTSRPHQIYNGSKVSIQNCDLVNCTIYTAHGSRTYMQDGTFTGSLQALYNSDITVIDCPLSSTGTLSLFSADYSSKIYAGGTATVISDASGTGTSAFMIANHDSEIYLANAFAISTTTGRTATLVTVNNGSKLYLPNFTVTSALTSNDLINADRGSEIYFSSVTQLNTTLNMIRVQGASKLYSINVPVNSGGGTTLQRGSTLAGGYVYDTTWALAGPGGATDEMTLVLSI